MRKVIQGLKWELIIQIRFKIYLAALFVVGVWAVILIPMERQYKVVFVPVILFIDLAIIGFYFMGAMFLLEKEQKTLQALIVTPIRIGMYFFSKVFSLTLLSIIVSTALIFVSYDIARIKIGLFIIGITLNSIIYTLTGFITVCKYNSISEYLVPSWFYLFITQIPLIDYFNLVSNNSWIHWILFLHPTQGPLCLIKSAFVNFSNLQVLLSIIMSIIWIVILQKISFKVFRANIRQDKK